MPLVKQLNETNKMQAVVCIVSIIEVPLDVQMLACGAWLRVFVHICFAIGHVAWVSWVILIPCLGGDSARARDDV